MRATLLVLLSLLFVKSMAQIQVTDFTHTTAAFINPRPLLEYDSKIYFNGSTDGIGQEVWATDGNSANTALLKDINPLEQDGLKIGIVSTILNGDLYFLAKNDYGYGGGEIWKTNGTTAGTIKIFEYNGRVTNLTTVGNQIYFIANSDEFHYSVWKTDGTTPGTALVYGPTGTSGNPTFQGKANNTFIYSLPFDNTRMWRSDGTAAGTYFIIPNLDGNGSGPGGTPDLSQYIEFNNTLYFVSRNHLYHTDGTLSNTGIAANVWNGSAHTVDYSDVIVINNKMYLLFYSYSASLLAIYESDGTQAGTSQIYTEPWSQLVNPSRAFNDNGKLLFTTGNGSGGTTLKSLNTTNNQVSVLAAISTADEPDFIYSNPFGSMHKIAEGNYFLSRPLGIYQNAGYIYDAAQNTVNHVAALDNIASAIVYNQELYYSKDGQLWKYSASLGIQNPVTAIVALYPNPSSGFVSITGNAGIQSAAIYDVNGRLVVEIPTITDSEIDISALPNGIYFVKMNHGTTSLTKKLIKE